MEGNQLACVGLATAPPRPGDPKVRLPYEAGKGVAGGRMGHGAVESRQASGRPGQEMEVEAGSCLLDGSSPLFSDSPDLAAAKLALQLQVA